MITKEEIKRIPAMHKELSEDIKRLRWVEENVACNHVVDQKIQSVNDNKTSNQSDEAIELKTELEQRQEELIVLKRELEEWIKTLEDSRAQRIMMARYIECHRWKWIAKSEGITTRRCYQIINEVLSTID